MTMAEFANFIEGFAAFHGAKGGDAPTDDEYLAALAEELARPAP